MTDRRGVVLLFFDFPTETKRQQKEYRQFRKHIISDGYVMIQKSVYAKLIKNRDFSKNECGSLKKHAPKDGSAMILPISLSSFFELTSVIGEPFDLSFFSDTVIMIA